MTRQKILITGASSGLGAEMARQFAALGHDLALTARRTDRLDELKAQILADHPGRHERGRCVEQDGIADRAVLTGQHCPSHR